MIREQLKTIESYNRTAENFFSTIARLKNYNHTYDYIANRLNDGDTILDLACGPAQISRYLKDKKNLNVVGVDLSSGMLDIARKNIPDGEFIEKSIIDFNNGKSYDAAIIGFGIPFLNEEQVNDCIHNTSKLLKPGKYLYISFMNGSGSRIEKTSFGGTNDFLIYYYSKEYVAGTIQKNGMKIIQNFEIDYKENDGSITKDIIIIAQKI